MAIYPGAIPSIAQVFDYKDDVNWMYERHWDAMRDELIACLTELGTSPSGASETVAARLALLEGGPDKQNLDVKANATNPAYQIDIDADYLQVDNHNLSAVNLTVDITSEGANGLDTGDEAADTWYSIWVIYKPSTDTTAGLLSLSTSSPTMPADYTKKRRVGWVRNNNSSNFWDKQDLLEGLGFHTRGIVSAFDFSIGDFTTDGTFRELDLSALIPPGAKAVSANIELRDDAVDSYFSLNTKGYNKVWRSFLTRTTVVNVTLNQNGTFGVDADRKAEYYGKDVAFTTIALYIGGWFF